MAEILRIKDRFYISTSSVLAGNATRVLKHGDMFAVFDRYGDIHPFSQSVYGLYNDGTRFLSSLQLSLGKDRPLLLSSTIREDNALLTVDLTNPDVYFNGEVLIPRGNLHLFRSILLWNQVCYERLKIINYGLSPIDIALTFQFSADFADIFEVRGLKRKQRGRRLPVQVKTDAVVLSYQGLDRVIRQTHLEFNPTPVEITGSAAFFSMKLNPKEEHLLYFTVSCQDNDTSVPRLDYDHAYEKVSRNLTHSAAQNCDIYTSNEQFNDWLNRSFADLRMMITDTPNGPYPYAGVPWFNTPFGRDGIITAMEVLWLNPGIARGVLLYLASTQAREVIPEKDAEPGKILHETRRGEMAALGEVPFGQYYGSVDATPLFIMLAAAYYRRTGDRQLIEQIWGSIELALHWLETYADADGDGFAEYNRSSEKGLIHQGWKDSHDSIFHADGRLAAGPIALCEMQAYVYGATQGASELAAVLGYHEKAEKLARQSGEIQEKFERTFWSEDLSSYGLALDGAKKLCRVLASNAGHCLFTGIATPEHARRVSETLLSNDFFSGWGIRTIAASEARFNPMSYHNGSVWPHDNAMIAHGFARYGFKKPALKILAGLFDASLFLDLHRMPELFCGFHRRPGESPTLYPVACSPQAWSSGAIFMLLQAALGITINATTSEVIFSYPVLPEFLREVRIKNLQVGKDCVDLIVHRHAQDVGLEVVRGESNVKLLVIQ